MSKKRIEDIIRDKLKKNLTLIEDGLSLIDDEYHVKNTDGASGFIDIFAKDKKNNLVIIELKRSDAACREAITELSKYIALIRRLKNLTNSEIRIIIISTHWHELLVPFSEFYNATNYQLEGYLLTINTLFEPIEIKRINPLPEFKGRNICRRHFAWYYKNEADLNRSKQSVIKQASELNINDYILVDFNLNFTDNFYQATKVLYWAQQLKTKDFYINQLNKIISKEELDEFIEYISELDDDDDALDELADRLFTQIEVECETCEIAHPEKLVQKLNDDLWTVNTISKHGVFNEDERLTDEMLLIDLEGYSGASFVHYFASTKTENRSKITEINCNINNPLFHNDTWKHKIQDILKYAEIKTKSTITIYIYNKDDLLETIWLSKKNNDSLYIPTFLIIIDPEGDEDAEIFIGNIVWIKQEIDLEQTITNIFNGFNNYIFERHFGAQRTKDSDLMKALGFEYEVDMISINHSGENLKKNISIRGKNINESSINKAISFSEFLKHKDYANTIVDMFEKRNIGNGMFSF